jgi:hypothetical protein
MTTRDPNKPASIFDQELEENARFLKKDRIATYRNSDPDASGVKPIHLVLVENYSFRFLADVGLMYSRGDDLAEIKRLRIDPTLDRLDLAVEEIEKYRHLTEDNSFYPGKPLLSEMLSVYTIMAWMLCFGADTTRLAKLFPYLLDEGQDQLADTVIASLAPDRKIGAGALWPKAFGELNSLVDATSDERQAHILAYAKRWPGIMGKLNSPSIGIAVAGRPRTYKKMVENIGGMYGGYWAWEMALVVKFFGIDDTQLREFPYYPADLVEFAG